MDILFHTDKYTFSYSARAFAFKTFSVSFTESNQNLNNSEKGKILRWRRCVSEDLNILRELGACRCVALKLKIFGFELF